MKEAFIRADIFCGFAALANILAFQAIILFKAGDRFAGYGSVFSALVFSAVAIINLIP